MRSLLAPAIGICGFCAASASASFVVASNLPVTPEQQGQFMVQAGNFSDALSSDGEYFNGLGLAQGFTSDGAYNLSHLTVWGASTYAGHAEPWLRPSLSINITGFEVVLMKQNVQGAFVTQHTWNVGIGAVTQTATGNNTPNTFSPVFQLGMDLAGDFGISAGVYYLAVGAVLNNPDGDAWQWINGQWDGTVASHQYIATVADTPTSWGQWSGVPTGVSGSMILESSTIPAPAVSLIMATGALAGGRRRRR